MNLINFQSNICRPEGFALSWFIMTSTSSFRGFELLLFHSNMMVIGRNKYICWSQDLLISICVLYPLSFNCVMHSSIDAKRPSWLYPLASRASVPSSSCICAAQSRLETWCILLVICLRLHWVSGSSLSLSITGYRDFTSFVANVWFLNDWQFVSVICSLSAGKWRLLRLAPGCLAWHFAPVGHLGMED
jgi:hypothetical protein